MEPPKLPTGFLVTTSVGDEQSDASIDAPVDATDNHKEQKTQIGNRQDPALSTGDVNVAAVEMGPARPSEWKPSNLEAREETVHTESGRMSGLDDDYYSEDVKENSVPRPDVAIASNVRESHSIQENIRASVASSTETKPHLINSIKSRNWFLIFHMTIFGAFVGLIIYIVEGNPDFIWFIGAALGAVAFVIDHSQDEDKKMTRYYGEQPVYQQEKKWPEPEPEVNVFRSRSEYYDVDGKTAGFCDVYANDNKNLLREQDERHSERQVRPGLEVLDSVRFSRRCRFSASRPVESVAREPNDSGSRAPVPNAEAKEEAPSAAIDTDRLFELMSDLADSRVLVIRERHVYKQENYKGYETGGGVGSALGTAVAFVLSFLRYAEVAEILPQAWFDAVSTQVLTWVLLSAFVIFVMFLIGCMLELELRRSKFVYPKGWSTERMVWFPVYEIDDWGYESIGYYNLQSTDNPKDPLGKAAYRWYRIMAGVVGFVVKSVFLLVKVLARNPPFGLWFVVSIAMIFVYIAHITKVVEVLTASLVSCCLALAVSVALIVGTSKGDNYECCKKKINTIKEDRVSDSIQYICKMVFAICALLLLACIALNASVIVDFYDVEQPSTEKASEIWDSANCAAYFELLECEDSSESVVSELALNISYSDANWTTWDPTSVPTADPTMSPTLEPTFAPINASDADMGQQGCASNAELEEKYPLCAQYDLLLALVVCLSVVWCVLWFASVFWYYNDKTTFERQVEETTGRYDEYAKFTIKRRVNRRRGVSDNNWFSSIFGAGGSDHKSETFNVDLNEAVRLHSFLSRVISQRIENESIQNNEWFVYILQLIGIGAGGSVDGAHAPGVANIVTGGGARSDYNQSSTKTSVKHVSKTSDGGSTVMWLFLCAMLSVVTLTMCFAAVIVYLWYNNDNGINIRNVAQARPYE